MSDPRMAMFLRSGAGLLVVSAVVAWLWVASRARVARRFGALPGDVAQLAAITWTCAIVTVAAIVLGAFGELGPFAWAALAAALGLWLRGRAAANGAGAAPATVGEPASGAGLSWPFALGTAAIVLGRVIFDLRNPPVEVDTLQYHLPMVAHWMATHALGSVAFEPRHLGSYFPGNVEILSLASAWATGRETLMTLPAVLGLGLLALGLRGLAIEAGARRAVAEVLALGLACAPGVVQLTTGLRAENIMAGWLAVALLFALRARRTGAAGDHEVMLVALGLFGGCKTTAPVLVAMVLLLTVTGERPWAWGRRLLANPAGFAALAITAGFWPLRNAIAAGNPLYPGGLSIGPWRLPGMETGEFFERTSQWAMWRAGLPGQMTPANVWTYYGAVCVAVVPGVLAGAALLFGTRRAGVRRVAIAMLLVVATVTTAMTVTQPYSGANKPPVPGVPMAYVAGNVRYATTPLAVFLPLAAVGLSQLPVLPVTLGCAALMVPGLVPRAGHVLPALALCAVFALVVRLRPRSRGRAVAWNAGLALVLCVAMAAVVALADPMRNVIAAGVWEGIIEGKDGVPVELVRRVRAEAGGRPLALSGVNCVWGLYGRDLKGSPEYVPVSHALALARSPWSFAPDRRDPADSAQWLRNLEASGARFVLTGSDERIAPLERGWCDRDTARFTRLFESGRAAVYEVRER